MNRPPSNAAPWRARHIAERLADLPDDPAADARAMEWIARRGNEPELVRLEFFELSARERLALALDSEAKRRERERQEYGWLYE